MFDIAKYFIEKKVTSWMVTCLLLIGGVSAFLNLGQLEDPEFTIPIINIITPYPGATPEQVEDEVTYLLESEMQNLPYVDEITSSSKAGQSKLQVTIKDTISGEDHGQIWDEVRKKIRDISKYFPPGVQDPIVVDDFSDVFGVLYTISSEEKNGYSLAELEDVANDLSKVFNRVNGVAKVTVSGAQQEQVFIEVARNSLATMGIPVEQIAGLLSEQNVVSNAGYVNVGDEYIRLHPTGEFNSVEELGLLTITSASTGQSVKLKDIANIYRGYKTPSTHILHAMGSDAVALGVSFSPGVNVVEVGKELVHQIEKNSHLLPLGISLDKIYFQGDEVDKSVKGFLKSLMQAVLIVVVVLLLFMGIKSGLLIGLILSVTILGTFIVMDWFSISLQRISLGGLIIALGMLVDNAIVVTEGILMGLKKGRTKVQAASDIVKQTKWPLLGATVIAITAFAPMGLSPDAVGEFVGSLFWVLLISLLLSWFTAITLTPFFCDLLFKEEIQNGDSDSKDPYSGILFNVYKKGLQLAMTYKWTTVILLVVALVAAGFGFTKVKQAFFPSSATPMFFIELRYAEGTSISTTTEKIAQLETLLANHDSVDFFSTSIANGFPRFQLTYNAVETGSNNAQLVVRTQTTEQIDPLFLELHDFFSHQQPEVYFSLKKLELGPGGGAKIEVRFSGDDTKVLRQLSQQAQDILHADGELEGIRDNWKQPVKVLEPIFNAAKAAELGISKQDFDKALLTHLQGQQVGAFRDGTKLLPIVVSSPKEERQGIDQLKNIQIFSNGQYINITEVVSDFNVVWEDPIIERKDRVRTLTVLADPALSSKDNANTIFTRIRSDIEAIEIPVGYEMQWGGEYESSTDAQKGMAASLPMGYLFMFIITLLLFNSVKESLMVWFCVPLTLIGVASGLLLLDVAFGFMGFLGFLSLSGMVLKNGIVLIDQVNVERQSGKNHYDAMFDAAVSRLRPVLMAAITTILGLAPLLTDIFFQDMAVVISFGLGFATVLTLLAVPAFYMIFNKSEKEKS